jgi:hypothetical protein
MMALRCAFRVVWCMLTDGRLLHIYLLTVQDNFALSFVVNRYDFVSEIIFDIK